MRFSKQTMLQRLYEERDILQRDLDFDPSNGWSQVLKQHTSEETLIRYGRFDMLTDLIEDLES